MEVVRDVRGLQRVLILIHSRSGSSMEIFGLETLARQTDICVCSHPTGGEMPLRRTRTFDSERQEAHTVLENDDVGGDDGMRTEMDSKPEGKVSNLPEILKYPLSSSALARPLLLLLLWFSSIWLNKNDREIYILVLKIQISQLPVHGNNLRLLTNQKGK